jgi:hypothetical protein
VAPGRRSHPGPAWLADGICIVGIDQISPPRPTSARIAGFAWEQVAY